MQLSAAEAALRRRLFRARGPLGAVLASRPVSFWYLGEASGELTNGATISLELSIGPHRAELDLPVSLVETLLHDIDSELRLDKLDGTMLPVVMQGFYADVLDALEMTCRQPVDLQPHIATASIDRSVAALRLWFRCDCGDGPVDFTLTPAPSMLPFLTELLESLPPLRQALPVLPLILTLERGAVLLRTGDVHRLRLGDVILPHDALTMDTVHLCLADRWRARGRCAANQITLASALLDIKEASMDRDNMATSPQEPTVDDAGVDELLLKVTFEVGRVELTLGELRSLGPGYVFTLTSDPRQSVDLCVGGRRIGKGELVEVGGQLGVKVVRLHQDG